MHVQKLQLQYYWAVEISDKSKCNIKVVRRVVYFTFIEYKSQQQTKDKQPMDLHFYLDNIKSVNVLITY